MFCTHNLELLQVECELKLRVLQYMLTPFRTTQSKVANLRFLSLRRDGTTAGFANVLHDAEDSRICSGAESTRLPKFSLF